MRAFGARPRRWGPGPLAPCIPARWPCLEMLAFWGQGSGGRPRPGTVLVCPGVPGLPSPGQRPPGSWAPCLSDPGVRPPAAGRGARPRQAKPRRAPSVCVGGSGSEAVAHGGSAVASCTPSCLCGDADRAYGPASDPAPGPWGADAGEVRAALRGTSASTGSAKGGGAGTVGKATQQCHQASPTFNACSVHGEYGPPVAGPAQRLSLRSSPDPGPLLWGLGPPTATQPFPLLAPPLSDPKPQKEAPAPGPGANGPAERSPRFRAHESGSWSGRLRGPWTRWRFPL